MFSKIHGLFNRKKSLSSYRKLSEKLLRKQAWGTLSKISKDIIALYPNNSYGYMLASKVYEADGNMIKAHSILAKAPGTKAVKKRKKNLQSNNSFSAKTAVRKSSLEKKQSEKTLQQDPDFDLIESKIRRMSGQDVTSTEVERLVGETKSFLIEHPSSWKAYELLVKELDMLNYKKLCIAILLNVPASVNKPLGFYLLLTDLYEKVGNNVAALEVLLNAQIYFPRERRVLFKISEMYKNDGRTFDAYVFLLAGFKSYPVYGAIRRLSFETDYKMYVEADETIDLISRFNDSDYFRFLPMLNRVSPFYPSYSERFAQWRDVGKKSMFNKPERSKAHFEKTINTAVKSRFLGEAYQLIESSRFDLSPSLKEWVSTAKSMLGPMYNFLGVAEKNETIEEPIGVYQGVLINSKAKGLNAKIVEVFIPTVFFADPKTEKPSYVTVRAFFNNLYLALFNRDDIVIVPRHQYNWRYCSKRLGEDAYSISYHTNNNSPCSLHVQESTLPGRCSIDSHGYAGFSSIANDFESINKCAKIVSNAEVDLNFEYMKELYVKNNKSKYEQSESNAQIEGPYIFLPLQVTTDVVAELAWIPALRLLEIVAQEYRNSDVKVVVKRHPYCTSISVQEKLESLERQGLIHLSTSSVHALITGAEVVYTVNSGVGLEALMHLKPVVVTGKCDYLYAASFIARTEDQLVHYIQEKEYMVDRKRIKKFLYYYNEYAISCDSYDVISSRLDAFLST